MRYKAVQANQGIWLQFMYVIPFIEVLPLSRLVQARMEFTDENSQETIRLEFDGVHFVSQGSIVGLVEPFGYIHILILAIST